MTHHFIGEIMQLKMWTEESKKETKEEQLFVRLHLKNNTELITLSVCDKNGIVVKDGNLVVLDVEDSVLIILNNIGDNVPLKKNYFSEIEVVKERDMSLMELIEKDRVQSQFTRHVLDQLNQGNKEEKKPTIN